MTYNFRYNIPILKHQRSNSTQDPIDYNWYQTVGTTAKIDDPYSLRDFALPAGLTERDVIHFRVGIKEGSAAQGMRIYLCEGNSSYDSDDLLATVALNPDDTAQTASYPVAEASLQVNAALVTASANSKSIRSWVSPNASGTGTVYMIGLMAWVEKNGGVLP